MTAKQRENKNLAKPNEADIPKPKPLGKRNRGSQPLSREDQNYSGHRNPDTPGKGTKKGNDFYRAIEIRTYSLKERGKQAFTAQTGLTPWKNRNKCLDPPDRHRRNWKEDQVPPPLFFLQENETRI